MRYVVEVDLGMIGIIGIRDRMHKIVVAYDMTREEAAAQVEMLNAAAAVPRCPSCGAAKFEDSGGPLCNECEDAVEKAR